jgi:DNA-binding NarL/FixJ family response regulator
VDDHKLVRTGLANILEAESDINVVGAVSGGVEAISKTLELRPDVIIMDIFIRHYGGLETMVSMMAKGASARVLILTTSEQEDDLFQALKFGAHGYLLKSASITEVVEAVRRTAAGETTLSPGFAIRFIAEFQHMRKIGINAMEAEVIRLLGKGLTHASVASRLSVNESMVKNCLRSMLEKVHQEYRAEAVAYAAHLRLRDVHRGVIGILGSA